MFLKRDIQSREKPEYSRSSDSQSLRVFWRMLKNEAVYDGETTPLSRRQDVGQPRYKWSTRVWIASPVMALVRGK